MKVNQQQLYSQQIRELLQLVKQKNIQLPTPESGQELDLAEEPDNTYDSDDYYRLLNRVHETGRLPHLGLSLGAQSHLANFGILGYAMLSSDTLDQAMDMAVKYATRPSSDSEFGRRTQNKQALVTFKLGQSPAPEHLLIESWLVGCWHVIQALLPDGLAACASYATVTYPAPRYHKHYEYLLGCPVFFNQPENSLAIPVQWLKIGLRTNNLEAIRICEQRCSELLKNQAQDKDITHDVKMLLLKRPQECEFKLEKTAQIMGLTARTLRRYLTDAGTSFRTITLGIRMQLAEDYLRHTHMTPQEIAFQLGYQHDKNFFRAFKQYFGKTTADLRL